MLHSLPCGCVHGMAATSATTSLTHALARHGHVIVHKALDRSEMPRTLRHLRDLVTSECTTSFVVFNPDSNRIQCPLPKKHTLRRQITDLLNAWGLLRGRSLGEAVVLHSYAGCAEQPLHCDYNPDALTTTRRLPLAVLVALQDGTQLVTGAKDSLHLEAGDVLIFTGNFVHAGAAYPMTENTRVHFYIESDTVPRVQNETYLV